MDYDVTIWHKLYDQGSIVWQDIIRKSSRGGGGRGVRWVEAFWFMFAKSGYPVLQWLAKSGLSFEDWRNPCTLSSKLFKISLCVFCSDIYAILIYFDNYYLPKYGRHPSQKIRKISPPPNLTTNGNICEPLPKTIHLSDDF